LEMNTYGHEGEVIGPVLGAYGEFSQHAYELADLIATKRAHDFCELNNMSLKQAKSMFTRSLRRKWGLYAHRGWAIMVHQRSRNLSSAADHDVTGAVADDTDAFMEFNHTHPDRGGGYHPAGGLTGRV